MEKISDEEIKQRLGIMYDCPNCYYKVFNQADELEECTALEHLKKLPQNEMILRLKKKYDFKKLCEYWQPRPQVREER